MSLPSIVIFLSGLYIGKYYPQYVPLPRLNQENIGKVLKTLEELGKRV